MRKIENWLLLPAFILLFRSIIEPLQSFDIHLHDTYFVFDGVSLLRFPAYALLIIFGMYKTVRHRHENIDPVFALPHIVITILLTGVLLFPSTTGKRYVDFTNWSTIGFMQWNVLSFVAYLLVQVIFLGYFVVQLIRKPAPGGQ